MTRIFLAIHALPALQAEAIAWQADYENLPVRWLKGHNLHLTIIPPWYVNGDELRDILDKLRSLRSDIKPFAIRFERVAYGPNPRSPRLIWAEGRTPREIEDLKLKIENLLGQLPKKRPFNLHLTLARFRQESFSQFPLKHLDVPVDWQDEVKSFVLMEAHLAPSGAEYEVLGEFKL